MHLHGGVDDLSADLVDVPHPRSSAILRGLRGCCFEADMTRETPAWTVAHPPVRKAVQWTRTHSGCKHVSQSLCL
jgi:hypothetical protein